MDAFQEIRPLYVDKKEEWRKVNKLYSFNSINEITGESTFDNEYYISTLGRMKVNGIICNNKYDANGYLINSLTDINGIHHRFKRHQIVMQTFNPNGYKKWYSVDHINRYRKYDNSIYNLRWADRHTQVYNRENVKYKLKEVQCINDGKIFKSCQEAERYYGLVKNTVSRVARGERKSIHGFIFQYTTNTVANAAF